MTAGTVTSNDGVDKAIISLSSIANDQTRYYAFLSWPYEQAPPTPSTALSFKRAAYNTMQCGEKIQRDDVAMMTLRNDWMTGKVYKQYDDTIGDITDTYVGVLVGTEYRVFRCIYSPGTPSIVEPNLADPRPFTNVEDGYIWKYLYTVSQADMAKFATREYVPVGFDPVAYQTTFDRGIECVVVENPGGNYRNYTVGTFASGTDIRVGGDFTFGLDSSAIAQGGVYNNCIMKITTGEAAGKFATITNYAIVGDKKLVTVDRSFEHPIVPGDRYEIYPRVYFESTNGEPTSQAFALAKIDPSSGNSVSFIEVLEPGSGYRDTLATLRPDGSVGVTAEETAELRPIISPLNGHGFDNRYDLQGRFLCFAAGFIGNSFPYIANNGFSIVGMLRDPLYAEGSMEVDPVSVKGTFIRGDKLFRYRKFELTGTCNVFANGYIQGTNTQFATALRPSDQVLIESLSSNIIANVELIIDSTTIAVNGDIRFTESNCAISYIYGVELGEIVSFDGSTIELKNIKPQGFDLSTDVYGATSYATAVVSNTEPYLLVSGRPSADFARFNQLTTLTGNIGRNVNYVQNETMTGPSGSCTVHSYNITNGIQPDFLYVTDVKGTINPGDTLVAESGATFEVADKYSGEMVIDSGELVYAEVVDRTPRNDDQTEIFKLVIAF